MTSTVLHDPTSERSPLKRPRLQPPRSLDGLTVALFDIGKLRSDEFLDHVETRLSARGIDVIRVAKPTNAKPASLEVLEDVSARAQVVVGALAD